METLIVYFSMYGNTQLVAEKIAETIAMANGGDGLVRVISSEQLDSVDFEGADLVVMGTPTHKMNLPEAVRPVFERMPRKLGGKQVVPPEIFHVAAREGPLYVGDLQRAEEWAGCLCI